MADKTSDPRTVRAVPRVKGQGTNRVLAVASQTQRTDPRHFKLRTASDAYRGPFWGWWGRVRPC